MNIKPGILCEVVDPGPDYKVSDPNILGTVVEVARMVSEYEKRRLQHGQARKHKCSPSQIPMDENWWQCVVTEHGIGGLMPLPQVALRPLPPPPIIDFESEDLTIPRNRFCKVKSEPLGSIISEGESEPL